MRRYHSLDDALTDIGAKPPASSCRLVVSWAWWDGLDEAERNAYHTRCQAQGVRLQVDHRISRHFVEMTADDEPPLSSEHRA